MRWLLALTLACSMLSGCLAPASTPHTMNPASPTISEAVVVLGIADSGVNPYHEIYADPSVGPPIHVRNALDGRAPIPLRVSQEGSFEDRVEADQAVWAQVEPGVLYWFVGTRILAISFGHEAEDPYPILDAGHGNGVASSIKNSSPDAWIVVAQFPASLLGTRLEAFSKAAEATTWLARQPWVDVVSLSIGLVGSPPLPLWDLFLVATKEAAEQGKVVLVGAGNEPGTSMFTGTAGPPWVISVGGVESATHGEAHASKLVDVVSDYTQRVAGREPDEYTTAIGTSFATPRVAGALAEALLQARAAAGHRGGMEDGLLCPCPVPLATGDLRAALNATAVYWNTTDYEPLAYNGTPLEKALLSTLPILPAPWIQMGWGYVGPDAARPLAAVLQGQPAPAKPAEAQAFMAARQAVREAYWAAAAE